MGLLVVAAVGAILLVPHVVNGGFHADDWVDAARYAFPRNGSGFWASYENSQPYNLRDAYGLLRTAEFALLGTRTAPHLALTAIAAVAQAMLMLLLARRLGAPAGPATMLGLLVLLLPAADSNRFWGNGLQLTLFAGAFVLAGVLVALRGLEARRWKGWALHAGALVLFAASVNGYELAAPVIVLAGFLYVGRAPLRVALMRWSADIVVVGAVLLRYAGQRDDGGVTLRESLDHARVIGDHGLDVAARALVPVPGVTTGLVLVIAAVVVASALPGALGRPRSDRLRSEMRLGLGAVGAGVVLAGAGWLMIVPADMGYDPIAGGIGNRVNTVASFGLAVLVAGIAVIIAAWVRAAMGPPALSLPVLVTALLVPVALGDFLESRSDRRDWDSAASSGRALLRDVKRLVPDPPPGTTIFTFGVSGYSAPSVPIFGGGGSNDLLGAVRVTYDSGAVAGFPVLDGMTFRCGEAEMDLADTGEPSAAPYGRAVLVDLARRRVLRPRDRAGCRRATEALKPYAPVNETEG